MPLIHFLVDHPVHTDIGQCIWKERQTQAVDYVEAKNAIKFSSVLMPENEKHQLC